MATRTKLAVVPTAEEPKEIEVTTPRIPYLGGGVEVTVSRSYKINLGSYESTEITTWLKATVPADADMVELGKQLQGELDILQSPDLNRSADIVDDLIRTNRTDPKSPPGSMVMSILS